MGWCDTKLLGVMGHCGSFQLWRSQVGKNREISRIDAFCFAGEFSEISRWAASINPES
jgi:hypothetical protein